MATTIIGGSRGAIPGIDGGSFTGPSGATPPANSFQIRSRLRTVFSLVISQTSAAQGVAPIQLKYTVFNSATSAGASIFNRDFLAGTMGGNFQWIAYGLGG